MLEVNGDVVRNLCRHHHGPDGCRSRRRNGESGDPSHARLHGSSGTSSLQGVVQLLDVVLGRVQVRRLGLAQELLVPVQVLEVAQVQAQEKAECLVMG